MINETKIRNYAELMKELNLTGLEVTEGTSKIRLERKFPPAPPVVKLSSDQEIPPAAFYPLADPENSSAGEEDIEEITSPMVGVFYSAMSGDEAPLVSVGDVVKAGDVLCIIEAMKLMNEITSDKEGKVVEVCVSNGDVVDFGTVLFKIKKSEVLP